MTAILYVSIAQHTHSTEVYDI